MLKMAMISTIMIPNDNAAPLATAMVKWTSKSVHLGFLGEGGGSQPRVVPMTYQPYFAVYQTCLVCSGF